MLISRLLMAFSQVIGDHISPEAIQDFDGTGRVSPGIAFQFGSHLFDTLVRVRHLCLSYGQDFGELFGIQGLNALTKLHDVTSHILVLTGSWSFRNNILYNVRSFNFVNIIFLIYLF